MSAWLASSSATQQHAVAHFAHGTIAGYDALGGVSSASFQGAVQGRTFKLWVAGAAIVY